MKRLLGFGVLLACACSGSVPPLVAGGRVEPDTVWVDPSFGDSTHFLLAGAREWSETAVVWFDVQLLESADAYARVAESLADLPRRDVRRQVIDRLRFLSDSSWLAGLPVVDSLVESGAVLGCEPMWIVNGAMCGLVRGADASVLTRIPGVVRVFRGMPDRSFAPPDSLGPRFVATDATLPVDPLGAPPAWNLSLLGVPELWAEGLTGRGVGVVVHDGGFALSAGPARHSLWRNPDEIAGNGLDDDGDGYVDDVHGFQFDAGSAELNRSTIVRGQLVHGSAVAAIAAGSRTVDTGVQIGIAPGARWAAVMAVRNFHRALQWALEHEFDVYGMSFSYPDLGATRSHFRKMLENAALAGLFLVSGAGNSGDPASPAFAPVPTQLRTPEDIPFAVLAVSGVDRTGELPSFSSHGPAEWHTIDYDDGVVGKPDLATVNSDAVLPDLRGNEATATFRGNSFAAPHVVGIIALLLEADPDVSPWTLRRILMETARDLGPSGFDPGYGAGLVNAPAALRRLRQDREASFE